jgi:hypothetical protein
MVGPPERPALPPPTGERASSPPQPPPPLLSRASSPTPSAARDPAAAAPSAPTWRLRSVSGTTPDVTVPTVVGRNPSRAASPLAIGLLDIVDPTSRVSASHALLEPDHGALWVSDLASTNGTVVVRVDGSEIDVASVGRTRLEAGDELELGGFVLAVELSIPA